MSLEFDLSLRFASGPSIRARLALKAERRVTVLFGASGVGKTTVLRCVAGFERPSAGFVRFGNETWFDASTRQVVAPQQRGVGFVTQQAALFPHLTVAENVAFGLRHLATSQRVERVTEMAKRLGFSDVLDRVPTQLSGGQRQRVSLARALAPKPKLLLLDEPLSALDTPARERLRAELRGVFEEQATQVLLVTHDRLEALALGDELAVLLPDGVRQVGAVAEVFNAPHDSEVAELVGAETVAPAHVVRVDGGLVHVAVAGVQVVAVGAPVIGDMYVCIRAEDVVIEPAGEHVTSASNRLQGRVTALVDEGPLVRVTLEVGFPLVALVTKQSVERLGLRAGVAVVASLKAQAIRLVPRGRS